MQFLKSLLLLVSIASASQVQAFPETPHHLYLRCNATSWNLEDKNHLTLDPESQVASLIFQAPAGEDNCVITETQERNSWGSWQKYYGANTQKLALAQSYPLIQGTPESAARFVINFPKAGAYRLNYDFKGHSFRFVDASGSVPGQVAWQIQGQLSQDSFQRFYQIASLDSGYRLTRIDPKTGKKIWDVTAASYIGFNSDCADADRFYTVTGSEVQAYDVQTGALIWSQRVNKEFVEYSGFLNCFKSSSQIFLSYKLDENAPNKLAALRKKDGATLWTFQSYDTINPIGADAQRVYLSRTEESTSRTQALDQTSGVELWRRQDAQAYFQFDSYQRLLRQSQGQLDRLDLNNGQSLWSVKIAGSYIYSQGMGDAVYAQSDEGITRLDAASGASIWKLSYINSESSSTSTQVLKSGDVLVRNQTTFQVLEARTGFTRWEREASSLETFITEDQAGHLFEQNRSQLSLLDNAGQSVWTFAAPELQGKVLQIGNIIGSESELFVTLFEPLGKYPPTSLAALNQTTGAVKWIYQTTEPLTLVSFDDPHLIILGTILSGQSIALFR